MDSNCHELNISWYDICENSGEIHKLFSHHFNYFGTIDEIEQMVYDENSDNTRHL